MPVDRRDFLLHAVAVAASARSAFGRETAADGSIFPSSVRADFPIASKQTYLNSAAIHPMSVPASRALEAHVAFRMQGGGEGRADFGEEQQKDLKRRFARLIGAKADRADAATATALRRKSRRSTGMVIPPGSMILRSLRR